MKHVKVFSLEMPVDATTGNEYQRGCEDPIEGMSTKDIMRFEMKEYLKSFATFYLSYGETDNWEEFKRS